MSLSWDITDCADTDFLKEDDIWNHTQSITFATMAVGIGDLSEKNYPEFVARLTIFAKIHDIEYNFEVVRAMIGLRTNVSFETRNQWVKRIVGGEMDDIVRNTKKATV